MKTFTAITIAVLSLVAVVQLIRLVLGWEVTIAGTVIPLWASGIVIVVSAGLAFMLWREHRASP